MAKVFVDGQPDTYFQGFDDRECGDHRTVGSRAWCHVDGEWCYPYIPCRGCEIPRLRRVFEAATNWSNCEHYAPQDECEHSIALLAALEGKPYKEEK